MGNGFVGCRCSCRNRYASNGQFETQNYRVFRDKTNIKLINCFFCQVFTTICNINPSISHIFNGNPLDIIWFVGKPFFFFSWWSFTYTNIEEFVSFMIFPPRRHFAVAVYGNEGGGEGGELGEVLLGEGGKGGGGLAADGGHCGGFGVGRAAARRQHGGFGACRLEIDKLAFVEGLGDLFEGLVGLGVELDFVIYSLNPFNNTILLF